MNFNDAMEHMKKGSRTKFEGRRYKIDKETGVLLVENINIDGVWSTGLFFIKMVYTNTWELL